MKILTPTGSFALAITIILITLLIIAAIQIHRVNNARAAQHARFIASQEDIDPQTIQDAAAIFAAQLNYEAELYAAQTNYESELFTKQQAYAEANRRKREAWLEYFTPEEEATIAAHKDALATPEAIARRNLEAINILTVITILDNM